MNQTAVILLNKNVNRSLVHIISDLENIEAVEPMSKRLEVYWKNSVMRGKEIFKSGKDNFLIEYSYVFHKGKVCFKTLLTAKLMSFCDIKAKAKKH